MFKKISLVLSLTLISVLMFACSGGWKGHVADGDMAMSEKNYGKAVEEYEKALELKDNKDNEVRLYHAKHMLYLSKYNEVSEELDTTKNKLNKFIDEKSKKIFNEYNSKLDNMIKANNLEGIKEIQGLIKSNKELTSTDKNKLTNKIDKFHKDNHTKVKEKINNAKSVNELNNINIENSGVNDSQKKELKILQDSKLSEVEAEEERKRKEEEKRQKELAEKKQKEQEERDRKLKEQKKLIDEKKEREQSQSRNSTPSNNTTPKEEVQVPQGQTSGFKNCTELRKVYPEGVPKGHPAYEPKHDRDKDGWACE